jgi:hypothetical protein
LTAPAASRYNCAMIARILAQHRSCSFKGRYDAVKAAIGL